VFVEVGDPYRTQWPIQHDKDIAFTETGTITELDAQDIVLAAQVGLLPDPRLELHVFDLLMRYNMPSPGWIGDPLPNMKGEDVETIAPETLLEDLSPTEFTEVKKSPVHLRAVRSVFVEEGRIGTSSRGMSAQDVEFVVTEDGIENIAVVLPLTQDWNDNMLI